MAISDTITSMYENVGEVYDTITNVDVNTGKNLFDKSTITENTYIDEDGNKGSSQVTNLSDYIEVKSNTSYTLSYDYSTLLNSNQRNFAYYDENKTYISGWTYLPTNKTNTITTPNNAKYIRFSYDKNCYSIMLNEGTTALPYQPYTDNPTYKNIENIPSTIRKSYLDIMNNGIDKIWNNWLPKVTGSGETITLNNTIEAKMDFVYKGNTEQNSYTGKNLYDKTKISNVYHGTNNNGIITASNDCTVYFTNNPINVSNGDIIYFSADIKINSGTAVMNNINDGVHSGTTKITIPTLSTNYQRYQTSLAYNESFTINKIYFSILNITDSCEIKNIMVSKNSNITYEPYVGGYPSPNPDYPQDIQVVSGDNTIKVEGKNLFDTATIEQGGFNYHTGENYTSNETIRNTIYNIKPNTQYTISCNKPLGECAFCCFDKNGNSLDGNFTKTTNNNYTFTTNSSASYIKIRIGNSSYPKVISDSYDVQLEKSNQATTYEPYQGASYPINLGNIELCKIGDYQDKITKSTGKNLFDKDNINIQNGYLDYNGFFVSANDWWGETSFIKIKPNTQYTFSCRNIGTRFIWCEYTNNSVGSIVGQRHEGSTTFTTSNTSQYIRFCTNSLTTTDIQLEKGSTATSYEPYGKVWYLNKQIGKVVYTGSESGSWTPSTFGGFTRFAGPIISDTLQTASRYEMKSNYFHYLSSGGEVGAGFIYAGQLFAYPNQTITTEQNFRNWLSTHNTTVYYILATPTTTEITDTTLISQLEAIKKSYNSQTNISQTNDDKPFILDVVALGELEI